MAYVPGWGSNPTNVAWNSVQLGQRPPSNLQNASAAQWGDTGAGMVDGHPALPALWWLGFVILLVAWRVLDSLR